MGTAAQICGSETVNIVMCRSVLEHISDPAKVYREMYRILRPRGVRIFLTDPR